MPKHRRRWVDFLVEKQNRIGQSYRDWKNLFTQQGMDPKDWRAQEVLAETWEGKQILNAINAEREALDNAQRQIGASLSLRPEAIKKRVLKRVQTMLRQFGFAEEGRSVARDMRGDWFSGVVPQLISTPRFQQLWSNPSNRPGLRRMIESTLSLVPEGKSSVSPSGGATSELVDYEEAIVNRFVKPGSKRRPFVVHVIGAGLPSTKQPQRIAQSLKKRGIENFVIYATDLYPEQVEMARANIPNEFAGRIHPVPYNLWSGPLPQAYRGGVLPRVPKANLVVMTKVLENPHIYPHRIKLARNAYAGLRPGGLFFNIPDEGSPVRVPGSKPLDMYGLYQKPFRARPPLLSRRRARRNATHL